LVELLLGGSMLARFWRLRQQSTQEKKRVQNRNKHLIFQFLKLWLGGITFQDESLKGLEQTFQELKSKLDEIDPEAIRNKKQDFPVMPTDELERILRSKAKTKKKRKLLLTQIGYVRINMFSEYYERLQRAERNKEFDKAVKLMNKYVETIAVPFIPTKKQSSLTKRLKTLFSDEEIPEPVEYLREWRNSYEAWLKHAESMQDIKKVEEFAQLKTIFFTVYTHSFSAHNFPPVAR